MFNRKYELNLYPFHYLQLFETSFIVFEMIKHAYCKNLKQWSKVIKDKGKLSTKPHWHSLPNLSQIHPLLISTSTTLAKALFLLLGQLQLWPPLLHAYPLQYTLQFIARVNSLNENLFMSLPRIRTIDGFSFLIKTPYHGLLE